MSRYNYLGMYSFNGRRWCLDYTYGKSEKIRTKYGSYDKLFSIAETMNNAPSRENTAIWSVRGK